MRSLGLIFVLGCAQLTLGATPAAGAGSRRPSSGTALRDRSVPFGKRFSLKVGAPDRYILTDKATGQTRVIAGQGRVAEARNVRAAITGGLVEVRGMSHERISAVSLRQLGLAVGVLTDQDPGRVAYQLLDPRGWRVTRSGYSRTATVNGQRCTVVLEDYAIGGRVGALMIFPAGSWRPPSLRARVATTVRRIADAIQGDVGEVRRAPVLYSEAP